MERLWERERERRGGEIEMLSGSSSPAINTRQSYIISQRDNTLTPDCLRPSARMQTLTFLLSPRPGFQFLEI